MTATKAAIAAPHGGRDNATAMAAMTFGMAVFVVSDAFIKAVLEELPVGQTLTLRGLVAMVLVWGLTAWRGQLRWHRAILSAPMIARTLGEVGASVFFFLGLSALPLADATAILQSLPLVLTIASALFLREPVGWRRWTATAIGLCGVLMIVKPGHGVLEAGAAYVMLCVLCIAVRDLVTRRVPAHVPSLLLTSITATSVTLAGLAIGTLEVWRMPSPAAASWVALAGVLLVFSHYVVIHALRTGDISVVAPFRYVTVLVALLLGFSVWGHIPDGWALAGTTIVVAAGLYTFYRERLRRTAAPP